MSQSEETTAASPLEILMRKEVIGSLSILKEKERGIVERYFGLSDGVCWTYREIGELIGVGPQRIGQIISKALRRVGRWWEIDDKQSDPYVGPVKQEDRSETETATIKTEEQEVGCGVIPPPSVEELRQSKRISKGGSVHWYKRTGRLWGYSDRNGNLTYILSRDSKARVNVLSVVLENTVDGPMLEKVKTSRKQSNLKRWASKKLAKYEIHK